MSDKKPPTSGKGDKPRTINNQKWRDNYDSIDWGREPAWKKARKDLQEKMNKLAQRPPPSTEDVKESFCASEEFSRNFCQVREDVNKMNPVR